MERKDYLVEKLSGKEIAYLMRIVMTAKNKYIEKNYNYINNTKVLSNDSIILKKEGTVLDTVLQECQENIESALEFEKIFSNPSLSYIVGALSVKEKEVLFYLYKKDKSINETAEIMKVDRRTIRRIRDRVQAEITKKMIKGDI